MPYLRRTCRRSGRIAAKAATLNGKVVLFGGAANGFPTDTWVWDGATWTQQNVSGPSGRDDFGMAALDGRVVLFGGLENGSVTKGDTWHWVGASWTQDNVTGPSPRA